MFPEPSEKEWDPEVVGCSLVEGGTFLVEEGVPFPVGEVEEEVVLLQVEEGVEVVAQSLVVEVVVVDKDQNQVQEVEEEEEEAWLLRLEGEVEEEAWLLR